MNDKARKEFTHESLLDAAGVSAYLRALADGFENRTLRFSDRRGELMLTPHGLVSFEVQAESNGERAAFEVRFAWRGNGDNAEMTNGALRIEAREKQP